MLRGGVAQSAKSQVLFRPATPVDCAHRWNVIRFVMMNYKNTLSKMIRDGAFDKRLYHGIGHRRVWRHGVEQLRDATDRLVASGKMTQEEQKELLGELTRRIADKFAR